MGYTSADTTRTIQYVCAAGSTLTADKTETFGTPQLSLPVYSIPRQVPPASQKAPVVHRAAAKRPRFIIRGGFFSVDGSKKRLFVAGHLRKRGSEIVSHNHTVKQYAGVSV